MLWEQYRRVAALTNFQFQTYNEKIHTYRRAVAKMLTKATNLLALHAHAYLTLLTPEQ